MVIPPTFSVEDTSLCEGEPAFAWNSHTIVTDRDSVYLDTLVNAAGCDSLLTLNVHILLPTFSVEDTSICEGSPEFAWNGHTIVTDRDSIYLDTLVNAAGCDSLLTMNVQILLPTFSVEDTSICEGEPAFAWNSRTILTDRDSIYLDTLPNAAGCDSMLTLNVTIIPPSFSIDTMEICEGSAPVAWNNRTILSTEDSIYLDTLPNAAGCDSMLTMYVFVLPVNDTLLDTTICAGSPAWAWNGLTVVSDVDSAYQVTLQNQYGCDSLVTLNVMVIPPTFSVEDTSLCEGEPAFAWNSHTIVTDRDSVYLDTLVNAAGCDSLLTLNVHILLPTFSVEDTSICEGSPEFAWNGQTIVTDRDSIYLDTLVNAAGCDSLLTMNVQILLPTFSVEDTSICEGEPAFAWNSRTILTDRDSIYLDTLPNAAGCDSMLTLNVTIIPPSFSIDTMEICEGSAPVAWNNRTILSTEDSIYLDTLPNAAGCDSMLTMYVFVLPVNDTLLDTTICAGSPPWAWNGLTVVSDVDSAYQVTLQNQYGCDSLVTLNVMVIPPTFSVEDTSLCEGEPAFAWNSHTIVTDRDSVYLDTLVNAAGCDSLLTLNVHILLPTFSVEDTSICEGSPEFAWNSQTIVTDRDSIYLDTLVNAAGCDSLLTMNVQILLPTFSVEDTSICEGEPAFAWNSRTILTDRDSIYLDTLPNAAGCDSMLTLNVTIIPPSFSIDTMEICEGSAPVAWNNRTILSTEDSIYLDTLPNVAGCDSMLTMYVFVLPVNDTLLDTTICAGSPAWAWNGQTVVSDVDSAYQVTLQNQYGCDSLVTLNVMVIPPTFSVEDTSLCEGEPAFAWNSHTIVTDRDSVYLDTLVNAAGCDSLLTLNVHILLPTFSVEDTSICEGSPEFAWNSHTIVTDRDSIYLDTLVNAAGCDSLLTMNVQILLPTFSVEDTSICEGEPAFAWNSRTILTDRDSIYLDTLPNAAGCDSMLTLNVTIIPPSFSIDTMEICEGSAPVAWNNRTILSTEDSIYLDTLPNVAGCDSMLTMYVFVKPVTESIEDTTLCAGAPGFVWNSHNIVTTQDSIYRDTLTNSFGCDSLLTLNVFIIPPESISLDTSVCEGAPEFVWNSQTISTTVEQTYQQVFTNVLGCDSIVELSVHLIPQSFSVEDTALCEGSPTFAWNSHTIVTDRDSIYLDTLINAAGCDSLLTYNVTINPISEINLDTILCEGEPSFAWNSYTIVSTSDSIYTDTLVNALGCDSIVTLNVTIRPATASFEPMTVCEGDPEFVWNSHTVLTDRDSIYRDTLVNAAGCDSILTLDVTVLPRTFSVEDTSLCEGDPGFVWNGQVISGFIDSIYTDTLTNIYGCDSLLTLNVSVNPAYKITLDTTLCFGEPSFDWNGQIVVSTMDSLYLHTLTNASGCDSLIYLDVSILPVSETIIDTAICEGEPVFVWNSHTVLTDRDSIYLDTLPNAAGCDSLLTLNVTILERTYSVTDTTIYDTELPFIWNGNTYTSAGTYMDTLTNAVGCDSILTLNLNIIYLSITELDTTICEPDAPFVWNSVAYDTTGVYSDTLVNVSGGDSILILNLTVLEVTYSTLDTSICASDAPFIWNGNPYSISGTYTDTMVNAAGCDSILTLNLTIIEGTFTQLDTAVCETFTWADGDGKTYTSDTIVDYILGNGVCGDTMRLNLIVSPPIILDVTPINVLCYGDSTGSIDVSINGGIAPFSYLWNTGDTTQDLSNLPAGNYDVIVTDALGCSNSISVGITQPDSLYVTLDKITDVVNPGELTGSIEVTVGGGTVSYTYEWTDQNGNIVGNSEDLFNQPGGTYTLVVTDANNCTTTLTADIFEPTLYYLICPGDTILSCFEDLGDYPMVTTLSEFFALDASIEVYSECGIDSASFTVVDSVVAVSAYCYEELRTYSLLDSCGNTLSCVQRVIVDDHTPPVMSCPPTITVSDGVVPDPYADTTAFVAAGGSLDDNCAVVSFRHVSDVSDGNTDPETITRTYEVTDYCGNVATCSQEIEVYFANEFVIECTGLPSTAFECRDELPKYKNLQDFLDDGGYVYSHPYDLVESTFKVTTSSDKRTCPEKITYTFTIENENGDQVSCTKVFTVDDKTPPTLILPDKNIYCGETWPVYSKN